MRKRSRNHFVGLNSFKETKTHLKEFCAKTNVTCIRGDAKNEKKIKNNAL